MIRNVDILGQIYDIKYHDSLKVNGSNMVGYVCFSDQIIDVVEGARGAQMYDTILHECLHVMLHFSSIPVGRTNEDIEKIVTTLSPMLIHFIKTNKKLIKEIQDAR